MFIPIIGHFGFNVFLRAPIVLGEVAYDHIRGRVELVKAVRLAVRAVSADEPGLRSPDEALIRRALPGGMRAIGDLADHDVYRGVGKLLRGHIVLVERGGLHRMGGGEEIGHHEARDQHDDREDEYQGHAAVSAGRVRRSFEPVYSIKATHRPKR